MDLKAEEDKDKNAILPAGGEEEEVGTERAKVKVEEEEEDSGEEEKKKKEKKEKERIKFEPLSDKELAKLFKKEAHFDPNHYIIHVVAFEKKERKIYVNRRKRDKHGRLLSDSIQSGAIEHDVKKKLFDEKSGKFIGVEEKAHEKRRFIGPRQLEAAKAFAQDPSREIAREKEEADRKKEERKLAKAAKKAATPAAPTQRRTFWDKDYEEVYKYVPNRLFVKQDAQQQQQQQQQQPQELTEAEEANVAKIEEAFKQVGCFARGKSTLSRRDKVLGRVEEEKDELHLTYCFKVIDPTKEELEFFRLIDRIHLQFYNTIVALIDEEKRNNFDWKFRDVPPEFTRGFEAYLQEEMLGLMRERGKITRGVKICAKTIPARGRTLEEIEREVRDGWDSVARSVFHSARSQAVMAFESNIAKYQKAIKEGRSEKPFKVQLRETGSKRSPEVVEYSGKDAFLKFSVESDESIAKRETERAEKRFKRKQEKEERKRVCDAEKTKLKEEVGKNKDGKWHKCKESKRSYRWDGSQILKRGARGGKKARKQKALEQQKQHQQDVDIQASTAASPVEKVAQPWKKSKKQQQKKRYFVATPSSRSKLKLPLKLCGSQKVVDMILEDNAKKIVHRRLRYDSNTKSCFVDIIVRVEKTLADEAEKVISIDPGINPFFKAISTRGEILDCLDRKPVEKHFNRINVLQARIRKRCYEKTSGRSRVQYRRTTRTLKRKLVEMRRRFGRFRSDYHYREVKRIFKFGDTLILNALRVKDIAHESKERGNVGLGRGGRRNMYMLAPGYFVEKIKHVARRTSGKKVVKGGGERGTSKTCTMCGNWNADLGGSKDFICPQSGCKCQIDRDVNGAVNNLKETLPKVLKPDGTVKPQNEEEEEEEEDEEEEDEEEDEDEDED